MPAPVGNRYTEKWTKDATLELLAKAYAAINDKCYFLSQVTVEVGEYVELWSYLTKKFEDDPEVFQAIKKLYSKVESIITYKAANGDIVPSVGIFILKAYHNLVETSKVSQEITGKDGSPLLPAQINITQPNAPASDN